MLIMPPKKKVKTKQQMQVARKRGPRQRPMPGAMAGLDEPAKCWARLLNDPCNAPLCHPCYSGSNGGILVRSCTYANLTFTSSTAGFIYLVPGAGFSYFATTALDTTAGTLPTSVATYVPGYTYIANNAGSFRAAAACMKVTWGGTELNRQGYIRFGNVNTSDIGIPGSTGYTVSGLSNLFEGATRMPEETLEIKWRPTDFDQQTSTLVNTDSNQDIGRRGAVGIAVSSVPTGSILIIETTVVYEYQPQISLGLTAATASVQRSRVTMDAVIDALDQTGTWMYKIGHMVGQAASLANTVYGIYTNPVAAVSRQMARLTYAPRAQIMG